MRAHESESLGSDTVGYMEQLLCDPIKLRDWSAQSNGKELKAEVPLSPSLSTMKSAFLVTRTDSGNVDM